MTDVHALSLIRAAIITAGAGWEDTPQGFTAAGLCHGVGQLDDIPGIESVDNIHLEPLGSRVILHCPKKCRSETLAAKLVEYLPDAAELLTDDWQEAAALLAAHRGSTEVDRG